MKFLIQYRGSIISSKHNTSIPMRVPLAIAFVSAVKVSGSRSVLVLGPACRGSIFCRGLTSSERPPELRYQSFYARSTGRQATSAGSTKLAQNILFFGATSLTSVINTSPSFSPLPGTNSYPRCPEMILQISIPSCTLSSDFVEKQYACTLGRGDPWGIFELL